ncbi:MBL fold metallo-hydrolase [Jiangella mangrovi]|uniref:Ribonuclease BN (tRNA processing enzyme) n=1 Tax=Jiangella mangrovi TaxID=1524084 RepID=A0A7W9GUK6_9ACTN|nr:MBL fold metallo-hydrolase [Jiangella mangrovi]MBB5790325.1 ribonuclease BN (tRNA processing enzyme) [Jiangella mangrovi]
MRPAAETRFGRVFDIEEYDDATTVHVGDLELSFAETQHSELCFAARVTDGRASLVYSGDAGLTGGLVEHCKDADLVLLEATYTRDLPAHEAPRHLSARDAGELAQRAGADRLVLCHLGSDDADNVERLRIAAARFGGVTDIATENATFVL